MALDNAVGVTIVTGFLGSGKSTLIRRILTEHHGLRLVVVENEFGSSGSGIESAIVTQGIGENALEDFVELPNGCICCTAQDDLTTALSLLVREKRERIDHILVETSGLADPGPVAASFWVDESLEMELRLDAVVTVVDALHFGNYLKGGAETEAETEADTDGVVSKERQQTRLLAEKQVAVADVIILNKIDLVSADSGNDDNAVDAGKLKPETLSLEEVMESVTSINNTARVLKTERCALDINDILDIRAYDASFARRDTQRLSGHISHVGMGAAAEYVLFSGVYFDSTKLDRALGQLLWEENEEKECEIWRMKALVAVEGETCMWVYQAVHTLFDSDESDVQVGAEEEEEEERHSPKSHFVFIGRNLRKDLIKKKLAQAIFVQTEEEAGG